MDMEKVIKKAERIMCSTVSRDMIDSFCEDVIALLKEVAEKIQNLEEENNFLKSMQHGRKKVGSAEMNLQKIKAEFIGRDGSMNFRRGKVYDLWFLEKNGKYYISHPRMDAIAIPYDTMIAVKKNWNILSY